MVATNNKGQLLVEVGVVMLLICLVAFAALNELSRTQKPFKKYQFTQEDGHAKKYSRSNKK